MKLVKNKKDVLELACPKFEEWWELYHKRSKRECKEYFLYNINELDYDNLIKDTYSILEMWGNYNPLPMEFLKNWK